MVTQASLTIQLTRLQCCAADLAYTIVVGEAIGNQGIDCLYDKLNLIEMYIERLRCFTVGGDNNLTQTEMEDMLSLLNDLCGCDYCRDAQTLYNDSTGNSSDLLQQENSDFIELE